ncbi:MAG: DUF1653 domain-containing protein [Defluviitaleaceae bacterium]|nr:DUF1653 domain-containing protein [Defluviitaleaceae bacterium]
MIEKGTYRHYKGNLYEVINIAIHSETEDLLVIYKPLYGEGGLWARPLEMWDNTIEYNGEKVKRFERVVTPSSC